VAISHRSTSAATFAAGDLDAMTLPTSSAGDMMLLLYGGKPFDTTFTDPTNWNPLSGFTDGIVAAGNGTGSMQVKAWWKEHTGSEGTVTLAASGENVQCAIFMVFQKGADDTWDTPVIAGGGDATAGTGFSVTAGADPGITTGDACVSFAAFRDDTATPCSSHITPTATGVTFTNTHDPATDPESTLGGDMGMCVTRSTVSGTASTAPVLAATLAAAHTGSAAIVRLRVTAAVPRVPRFTSYPQVLSH
jgi:hypothetical protein